MADNHRSESSKVSDDELMSLASMLNEPVQAPLLWAEIENRLRREQRKQSRFRPTRLGFAPRVLLRCAAAVALILAAGSAARFFLAEPTGQSKILNARALEKVERVETEYEAAISELSQLAQNRLDEMDLELMLLYRDRLETIDAQIAQCKEALEANPGNSHIRRYMLAALQDKKATLIELLEGV